MRLLSFAFTDLLFCLYSFQFFNYFSNIFFLRRNLVTARFAQPEMFCSLIAGRHGAESQLHDIHLKLVHIYSLSVSSNKSNFILFNVFIVLQNILGESWIQYPCVLVPKLTSLAGFMLYLEVLFEQSNWFTSMVWWLATKQNLIGRNGDVAWTKREYVPSYQTHPTTFFYQWVILYKHTAFPAMIRIPTR